MLSLRHITITPCSRSLLPLRLPQGSRKLLPEKRDLSLTASCTLQASGNRHSSGAVLSLHDHVTTAHRNPHIITSQCLRPSDPASRAPPAPPMPSSSPSRLLRKFSSIRANYFPASLAPGPANKRFSYHISAAFTPKGGKFNPTTNVFHFNPHAQNGGATAAAGGEKKARPDSGQDSFFVASVNSGEAIAAGVTDGVGGYLGGSADFSHSLCEQMAAAAQLSSMEDISAQQLIAAGYERVLAADLVSDGGSTACVGVARPNGQLDVANLGDSGFFIVRQARIHYASQPQTHAFNTPYQLTMYHDMPTGKVPPDRRYSLDDCPEDATSTSHTLYNGDVVVFATDGVSDNLSSQEILRTVSDEMVIGKGWESGEGGISPSPLLLAATKNGDDSGGIQAKVAKAIAIKAKEASVNTKVDGPFARAVQREAVWGGGFRGGKPDDICVVCMVVVEQQNEPSGAKL